MFNKREKPPKKPEKKKRLLILGERFNKLRGDLPQAEFAKRIGLTAATVGYYENSERLPDAEVLHKICTACNVSSDYLLGLSDAKSRNPTTQSIHKTTKLSEKAIENIRNLLKAGNNSAIDEPLEFINALLEDAVTLYFLSSAYREYKRHYLLVHEIEKSEPENPAVLEAELNKDFKIFRCYNFFIDFLKNQSELWESEKEKEAADNGDKN